MNNIVTIQDLYFYRQNRPIFAGIDMHIARGKITAIMGPSGTGKTTLLKLIGGQLTPDLGKITVNNLNIHKLSRKQLYQLRKKMGMLFQSGGLFTNLSVFDNVAFPIREHTNLNAELIQTLVLLKLEAVGLRGAANLMPSELSGGMARRVALARAIALDPELILYDEPFTGQDPISMGVLIKLIKLLNEALAMTSVIVSHDVAETCQIAHYVYILAQGKVIGEGTPDSLFKNPSPEVQQFLQGLPDGPVPFHYPAIKLANDFLEEK